MPDTLVEFVLARLDETEEPVILHNEVAGYGKELQALLAQGILRSTSDAAEVPRPASMQPGDDLIVRKTAAGIFGVAAEDDYFDPVPLTGEDVRQYEINLSKLASRLRKENGIQGDGAENDDGLLWLGEKSLPQGGTADVYLCFPNYDEDQFWSRCRRLKRRGGKQTIMLLTPRPVRLAPEKKRVLDLEGIVIISLARSLAGLPEGESSSVAVFHGVVVEQVEPREQRRRGVTLREFMQRNCEPMGDADRPKRQREAYTSAVKRINEAVRARRVVLLDLAEPWDKKKNRGEGKKYGESALRERWAKICDKVSGLPDLKSRS